MKLSSAIKPSSSEFKENYAYHEKMAAELAEKLAATEDGGGEKARQYQAKHGKMLARERVSTLIDDDSTFLELSPLAGEDLYDSPVAGGGILTGVGMVSGRLTMIGQRRHLLSHYR